MVANLKGTQAPLKRMRIGPQDGPWASSPHGEHAAEAGEEKGTQG